MESGPPVRHSATKTADKKDGGQERRRIKRTAGQPAISLAGRSADIYFFHFSGSNLAFATITFSLKNLAKTAAR